MIFHLGPTKLVVTILLGRNQFQGTVSSRGFIFHPENVQGRVSFYSRLIGPTESLGSHSNGQVFHKPSNGENDNVAKHFPPPSDKRTNKSKSTSILRLVTGEFIHPSPSPLNVTRRLFLLRVSHKLTKGIKVWNRHRPMVSQTRSSWREHFSHRQSC